MASKEGMFFKFFEKWKKNRLNSFAKKMLKDASIEQAKVVVEFGPGTGIITRKILQRLASDAHFMVFELNNDFFKVFQLFMSFHIEILSIHAILIA